MNIKKLISSKFVASNFYLLIGGLVMNFFAFLFHFYMGRKLGPVDYGTLAVLMAFIGILSIPYMTIQLSISKFVAAFNVHKELGKLRYLFRASMEKLNKIFFIVFIVLLFFNLFLSSFLRIDYWLLFVASLTLLVMPTISVTRGFLQGIQNFKSLGLSLSLEGFVKFFLSAMLVIVGFSVGGAVFGVFVSFGVAGFYCFSRVASLRYGITERFPTKKVYMFTLPVLFTLLMFTSFYSLDLLLIKHFFSDLEAGYFSVINLLGKIVFFASFSVVQVMFPKVVEFSEKKKDHKDILFKSFLFMLVITLPIILLYFFFGDFIVLFLYGESYLAVANLIGLYALFIAFISFSQLFSLYLLSLKKMFFMGVLLVFLLLELLLIFLFHESLLQIIVMLIFLGFALFLMLGGSLLLGNKR